MGWEVGIGLLGSEKKRSVQGRGLQRASESHSAGGTRAPSLTACGKCKHPPFVPPAQVLSKPKDGGRNPDLVTCH